MAVGNGFKVCFRVTCFGNWGRDFENFDREGYCGRQQCE
jgi:hypothetical protein